MLWGGPGFGQPYSPADLDVEDVKLVAVDFPFDLAIPGDCPKKLEASLLGLLGVLLLHVRQEFEESLYVSYEVGPGVISLGARLTGACFRSLRSSWRRCR